MTETFIKIGDQTVNAAQVTPPTERRFRDAWRISGSVIELDQSKLPEVKAALRAQLDTAAEAQRLRYITAGAGQAMTYQQKLDEAKLVQGGESDPANVPVLAASIGIEADTLAACAALVITRWNAWKVIANRIEVARLNGKKAISDAATIQAAAAAFDAVVWPS